MTIKVYNSLVMSIAIQITTAIRANLCYLKVFRSRAWPGPECNWHDRWLQVGICTRCPNHSPDTLLMWRVVFCVVGGAIVSVAWFILCWAPVFGGTAQEYFMKWFGWWEILKWYRSRTIMQHKVSILRLDLKSVFIVNQVPLIHNKVLTWRKLLQANQNVQQVEETPKQGKGTRQKEKASARLLLESQESQGMPRDGNCVTDY